MPLPKLLRDIHYWGSLVLLTTTLIVATTGLLLAVRKDFHQLQPVQQEGSQSGLSDRPISGLLKAVSAHPEMRPSRRVVCPSLEAASRCLAAVGSSRRVSAATTGVSANPFNRRACRTRKPGSDDAGTP